MQCTVRKYAVVNRFRGTRSDVAAKLTTFEEGGSVLDRPEKNLILGVLQGVAS